MKVGPNGSAYDMLFGDPFLEGDMNPTPVKSTSVPN